MAAEKGEVMPALETPNPGDVNASEPEASVPPQEQAPVETYPELVGALAEVGLAVGADEAVGGVEGGITFDQLMQLVESRRNYQAKAYDDDVRREESKQKILNEAEERRLQSQKEERDSKAKNDADERERKLRSFEGRVRAVLAICLVLASIGMVFLGVTGKVAAQDLSQYLTPISGLTGIVIGYFFGRDVNS